jgi:hypothetical protein
VLFWEIRESVDALLRSCGQKNREKPQAASPSQKPEGFFYVTLSCSSGNQMSMILAWKSKNDTKELVLE